MILNKLLILRGILEDRLPGLVRWEKVGIYFHNDRYPSNTINDEETSDGHFYILWYRSRRKDNANPYEYKEIPLRLEDIDAIIKRQREKLRIESKEL